MYFGKVVPVAQRSPWKRRAVSSSFAISLWVHRNPRVRWIRIRTSYPGIEGKGEAEGKGEGESKEGK